MEEIIYCVCTLCGVRNNKDNQTGFCPNGHDSWLEYQDLENAKPFLQALTATGLSIEELKAQFLNPTIKQLTIIKPIQL